MFSAVISIFNAPFPLPSPIAVPEFSLDFESGFTTGQNLSEASGLPGGLVIRDTTGDNTAAVTGAESGVAGSNAVGWFTLTHNERQYLELDFSARPVEYLAFLDVDHLGVSGIISFYDGTTQEFSFDSTGSSGDIAEFYGIFRNGLSFITRVRLNASGDGLWGIDNIEYGILPGTRPVPEPSTLAFMAMGSAFLFWTRRNFSRCF